MRFCKCGCGRSWDNDALPSHRRGRKFHADCPNSTRAKHVASCKKFLPPEPCGCGVCGLMFQPCRRRKYHPDCPIQEETQRAQNRRAYAASRRKALGLPARAEPLKPRATRLNNRHSKRCNTCEGMAWRRPAAGCPRCGEQYQPEDATAEIRESVYHSLRRAHD